MCWVERANITFLGILTLWNAAFCVLKSSLNITNKPLKSLVFWAYEMQYLCRQNHAKNTTLYVQSRARGVPSCMKGYSAQQKERETDPGRFKIFFFSQVSERSHLWPKEPVYSQVVLLVGRLDLAKSSSFASEREFFFKPADTFDPGLSKTCSPAPEWVSLTLVKKAFGG